jgi:biopolymer transport protein ExbB/TolQ
MSGTMIFVIIMVAIFTVARIIRRAMELEQSRINAGSGGREVARLERENSVLRSKIDKLEERTAVLERIATDAPARLTAEIEKLRD